MILELLLNFPPNFCVFPGCVVPDYKSFAFLGYSLLEILCPSLCSSEHFCLIPAQSGAALTTTFPHFSLSPPSLRPVSCPNLPFLSFSTFTRLPLMHEVVALSLSLSLFLSLSHTLSLIHARPKEKRKRLVIMACMRASTCVNE